MRVRMPLRTALLSTLAASVLAAARRAPDLPFRLVDVSRWSGVRFSHDGGRSGRQLITDTMGSGGTLFDADGDGDLDLYLVTCNAPEPPASRHSRNALFENDGSGRFQRATGTGLEIEAFGLGAISFDYDGDGRTDVYVTNRGRNRLFRNEGDLRFEDVTDRAGVDDPRFSSSAAAADYDGDGDLDIYVGNYLEYDMRWHSSVPLNERDAYRSPWFWPGQPNSLYRNEGDGTFTDVSRAAGVEAPGSKTLGVAFVDLDDDGLPDILLANDTSPNLLYRNLGGGHFEDLSAESAIGYGPYGFPEAGMGIAIGDYDGDGRQDVLITNFETEPNGLYRNLGHHRFERTTEAAGLYAASLPMLGFGTDFADFDNDGDRDLFVANGHVLEEPSRFPPYSSPYAQEQQIFLNDGGRFRLAGRSAGSFFGRRCVGRATLAGDIDNDGDLDLVLTVNDGPALVLQNTATAGRARAGHFLTVVLRGKPPNTEGVGARVEVLAGGRRQVQISRCGTSYLADGDPRLHFGLGDATRVDAIFVTWPGGAKTELHGIEIDRSLTLPAP